MNTLADFFDKLGDELVQRTIEHLHLSFFAIAIAVAIALPLGVYLTRCRWPRLAAAILGAAAIVQTIPSLALVSFIAILFTLVRLPLIGEPPALVALVLYALLPILRNTYTGIRQVDPAVVEVARGMGMRPRQILFSVELPLSLPVIMAGIRIATVWTIGVATLTTLIGAGGLGVLIMRGLRAIQMDYLIAGTVPAAILAIVFDSALARCESWLDPEGRRPGEWSQKTRLAVVVGTVLLIGLSLIGVRLAAALADGLLGIRPGRPPLRAAFDAEFLTRPDGYEGMRRAYGFRFPQPPRQMDPGLMYRAVADGAVDVICAFATDGRIEAYDLVILEDDRGFFPPYHAAPLVRRDALEAFPELGETLELLAGRIDDETMRALNYAADEHGESADRIARRFLEEEELLAPGDGPVADPVGTVTIGGKAFTEQEILTEMMAAFVEGRTELRVRRMANLGGTKICFDALLSGDLDLYAEYTGTALVGILDREVIADADESLAVVREVFAEEYDLQWLEPFGFNNTYTLTMRREHAEELGISTISDLARHLRGE